MRVWRRRWRWRRRGREGRLGRRRRRRRRLRRGGEDRRRPGRALTARRRRRRPCGRTGARTEGRQLGIRGECAPLCRLGPCRLGPTGARTRLGSIPLLAEGRQSGALIGERGTHPLILGQLARRGGGGRAAWRRRRHTHLVSGGGGGGERPRRLGPAQARQRLSTCERARARVIASRATDQPAEDRCRRHRGGGSQRRRRRGTARVCDLERRAAHLEGRAAHLCRVQRLLHQQTQAQRARPEMQRVGPG